MERRTFEDSFRDAFRDVEATPSDKVWTNIELDLEKSSGGNARRRLMFYQLLAAAAVSLALLASGVAYVIIAEKNEQIKALAAANSNPMNASTASPDLRQDQQATANGSPLDSGDQSRDAAQQNQENGREAGAGNTSDRYPATRRQASEVRENATAPRSEAFAGSGNNNRTDYQSGTRPAEQVQRSAKQVPTSAEQGGITDELYAIEDVAGTARAYRRDLPAWYRISIGEPDFGQGKSDPVALMMARLADEERRLAANESEKKEHPANPEKLWTAVGFAAGGFNSVNYGASQPQPNMLTAMASYNNTSVPDKQAKASGVAYSLGVSMGAHIAPRWVIHGGVNYMTQSSNYTATNVVAGPSYETLQAESMNALKVPAPSADARAYTVLAPTVPYSVNNSLKYVSVPVQAGYLLINQKFGIQLNAGLSTDVFLQNTITPEGGSLDKTTQNSGSDSPYRTLNFSGLMGTEFSYRLGQQYRLSLNPGVRYPFSSVYKAETGIQSAPLTFDVGLRFRYIFK